MEERLLGRALLRRLEERGEEPAFRFLTETLYAEEPCEKPH
jgi:hypothetical protein